MDHITVELLHELVSKKDVTKLRQLFKEHNIIDLSDVVDQLSMQDAIFVYRALNTELAADLFAYLDPSRQEDLVNGFSNQELGDIIENLFSDDVIDLLEDLPANMQKKILQNVGSERRNEINALLNYNDGTAGAMMTTEYVELKTSDTAESALGKIRKQAHDAETLSYCFVIDDTRRLQGVVRLNEIVFTEGSNLIERIMDENVISVFTHDDQEKAAELIKKYDVNVLAVVNEQYRLIGIITVDDILDVIEEETTEDIQKMSAMIPLEDSYMRTTVMQMYRKRIVWLLILMITATFTQILMGNYEQILQTTSLGIFIPMLMDSAGNAGSQSSTLIIRSLALNEISPKDYMLVLMKEVPVALLAGITLVAVNFVRIKLVPFINPNNMELLILSLTLIVSVLISKVIGGLLPLGAKALKMDPAVMAGPLITTIVDAVTLLLYFMLAVLMMGNIG